MRVPACFQKNNIGSFTVINESPKSELFMECNPAESMNEIYTHIQ